MKSYNLWSFVKGKEYVAELDLKYYWASLVAQMVKNLPAMWETQVQLLGREDSPREGIGYPLQYSWAFLVAQMVKNLPAMWETWVQSLGWEDSLEEGMYSCLENPHGQRRLVGCSPWGLKESDITERLSD